MKTLFVAVLSLCTAASLLAGGVKKEQIPSSSKFVVHLDIDAFRSSQIGAYVFKEFLQKGLSDLQGVLNLDLAEGIYQKLNSITIYGSEFTTNAQNSTVVLVKADSEAQATLDKLVELVKTYDPNAIQKEEKDKVAFYTLNGTTHVAITADKPWILSNSKSEVEGALALLNGKGTSVAALPESPSGSVLQIMALSLAGIPNVPEQAKVFQEKVDTTVISVGEASGQLNLDMQLKAKTTEAATQLKQVLEGLVGLAALSQANNAEFQELIKSTKTTEANQSVNVKIQYPISKVFTLLNAIPRQ